MIEDFRDEYYTDELATNLQRISSTVRALELIIYPDLAPDEVIVGVILGLVTMTLRGEKAYWGDDKVGMMVKKSYDIALKSARKHEYGDVDDEVIRKMLTICNFS